MTDAAAFIKGRLFRKTAGSTTEQIFGRLALGHETSLGYVKQSRLRQPQKRVHNSIGDLGIEIAGAR